MEFIIRKYESSDIAFCRNLWTELTQQHRDIYEDQKIGGDKTGTNFDCYIEKNNLYGPWVVVYNDKVIGLSGLLVDGEQADIEPVIISRHYRNQGLGKKLVQYVVEEAKKIKVRFLSVKPVARNVQAISFFVKVGFCIAGHIDLFQDLSGNPEREWKTGIEIHDNILKY